MIADIVKNNAALYIAAQKILEKTDRRKVRQIKSYNEEQRKEYLSKQYKEHVGRRLDWNNLQRYTEKMQWAKLYDNPDIKSTLSDKFAVREWVKQKIGGEYLIPLIGVWNTPDEIDYGQLPDRFVLKTNNGTGTNFIIENKNNMNIHVMNARLHRWITVEKHYLTGLELHYSKIRPCILAEKYIEHKGTDLQDYKFLCFDGSVYYCWVDVGRYHNHKRNIYDLEWNLQPWNQYTYGNSDEVIEKPENFEEMIRIAECLSQGFTHVRVDLYNVKGKIYFGEMTFTNGSGFEVIEPDEYDFALGRLWHLPMDMRKEK